MKDYFKFEDKGIRIRHSADNILTEQMLRPFGLPFGNLTEEAAYTIGNKKNVDEIRKKIQLEIDRVGGNEKHFTTGEWKNVEVELYYNIIEATKVDFLDFIQNTYLRSLNRTKEWHERNQIEKGSLLKLLKKNDFIVKNVPSQIYICEDGCVNPVTIIDTSDTYVKYTLKNDAEGYERTISIVSNKYYFCVAV